jgi:hypothetical protein
MRTRIPRLGPPLAQRVVQQLPPFAGDVGGALDGAAKAVELARDVVKGRLHLAPQLTAALREKQIPCRAANDRANDCCNNRSVFHVRLLLNPGPSPDPGSLLRSRIAAPSSELDRYAPKTRG